ncbi:hypothetical protein Mapa_009005 [Marchantia paleacea]|nr:hypothetical protein Mapa_009005 [Marchantia paleacea]
MDQRKALVKLLLTNVGCEQARLCHDVGGCLTSKSIRPAKSAVRKSNQPEFLTCAFSMTESNKFFSVIPGIHVPAQDRWWSQISTNVLHCMLKMQPSGKRCRYPAFPCVCMLKGAVEYFYWIHDI